MSAVIGLDIGTTGCKAALFDSDGTLLASALREYQIQIPQPTWAEQNAELVWTLAQETLSQVVHQTGIKNPVAIGLSVQGEAVIPVNAEGTALRPAILGMDTRTDVENGWLRERFGAERLFEWTGMPVHTINTLPKLLWLKTHEPDIWQKAVKFLLYEDFIIQKMTGQPAISRCLASRTQLFDLRADGWCAAILEALELTPERLAPVQPSGTAIGRMRPELAETMGFSEAPLVVTGGHDQACGALGVGLTRAGLACVSTGTAEVMEVTLDAPVLNPTLHQGNISVYAHVVPDVYLAMTLNHSGGLLLRWFRDTFGQEEIRQAQQGGQDAYDALLRHAPQTPTNLLVLPHFSGSGTPTFDTSSKGAILGLTFATSRADVAKAILEGLTFELRLNVDLLKAGGVDIQQLRAIGGGARSALWVQLKADVTGIAVAVPRVTEAACWGAALLAGHGAGLFPDIQAKAEQTVVLEKMIQPREDQQAHYAKRYALYQALYPTLVPLLHQL